MCLPLQSLNNQARVYVSIVHKPCHPCPQFSVPSELLHSTTLQNINMSCHDTPKLIKRIISVVM